MEAPSGGPRSLLHHRASDARHVDQLGPYAIETLIERSATAAGTAYRVQIEPHQRTATSFHRVAEEFYYVLSGRGVAILDGQEHALQPGDFLRLPPGTHHAFVTADETLEMLDIHIPGCWPDHDTFFADTAPPGFGGKEIGGLGD